MFRNLITEQAEIKLVPARTDPPAGGQLSEAKTLVFSTFDKKTSKTRLAMFLKTRSPAWQDDCCQNEYNAVFGVFLQRLIMENRLASSWIDEKINL